MKLGRYRLVAELARGGMGVVWLAELRGPGGFAKRCVVKELLPELARDERHRAMFLDEARLAARLAHKNVVRTNDAGEGDGRWYMALELLEGCTLRRAQTLLGDRRLAPALAARIVREVLSGLHYAHELRDDDDAPLGVVHRDVSPQNVFLTFDGEVKLLDFGVAKSRARRDETRAGFAKGCIAYMSPDHVATAPIDRRADVFSAGVVLRELLTGERLWGDADDAAIVKRLVARDLPPFPTASGAPAGLRVICERAMAADRRDRWATAAAMRGALDAWLSAEDPGGSLADLEALFDGDLAQERVRARVQHRVPPPPKPPLPLELPPTELVTDPAVRVARPSLAARLPRVAKREAFVAAMALVACLAAIVSVASILSLTTTSLAKRPEPPASVESVAPRAPAAPPPVQRAEGDEPAGAAAAVE